MTPTDKSEQAELVELLAGAIFTTVFCWRMSAATWKVEKIAAAGDLTNEFGAAASAAATDLSENRSESAYNVEGGLADNEFAALANPRRPGDGRERIGGDLFPKLDDFGSAGVYGQRRRKATPNLYVVIAQLGNGEQAKFGRRITASNVLASSRGIRAVFDQGTFSKLDGTVVSFDTSFDWIEWRGMFLILDGDAFHLVFRNMAEMKAAVAANVNAIASTINILGSDQLIERCRASPGMMTKLQKVIDQRLYTKPIPALKAYSEKYPGLEVQWDGDALVFDGDLKHQWSILRLLDEAGFTGELSGDPFLSKNKDPL